MPGTEIPICCRAIASVSWSSEASRRSMACSRGSKPSFVTRTMYLPGFNSEDENLPEPSDVSTSGWVKSPPVISTRASGMTAPVWSFTVPDTVAACRATEANSKNSKRAGFAMFEKKPSCMSQRLIGTSWEDKAQQLSFKRESRRVVNWKPSVPAIPRLRNEARLRGWEFDPALGGLFAQKHGKCERLDAIAMSGFRF